MWLSSSDCCNLGLIEGRIKRGRLLHLLPWTLSVAKQLTGCSGVQRSSRALQGERERCSPTRLSSTEHLTLPPKTERWITKKRHSNLPGRVERGSIIYYELLCLIKAQVNVIGVTDMNPSVIFSIFSFWFLNYFFLAKFHWENEVPCLSRGLGARRRGFWVFFLDSSAPCSQNKICFSYIIRKHFPKFSQSWNNSINHKFRRKVHRRRDIDLHVCIVFASIKYS